MNIQISKPYFDGCEEAALKEVLVSKWLTSGQKVREFEEILKEFIGVNYAIAVSSGTAALHLSLLSLEIGRGDKIIVPSFSFIATANVVERTGADIIFCDIDLDTYNISITELEKLLSTHEDIKVVIPVHEFGLCADMLSIMKLKKKYNFFIIEDAACALGSYIRNKHAGTFGEVGCFSFHPRKIITTGEGGLLVTNNRNLAEKLYALRNHGIEIRSLNYYSVPDVYLCGLNYRLTEMQAAIGICQMKKINKILERRRKVAEMYVVNLKGLDFLKLPKIPESFIHSFQSFVVLYTGGEDIDSIRKSKSLLNMLSKEKEKFMKFLKENGIETRPGGYAIPFKKYFIDKYGKKEFINGYIAEKLSVALPIHAELDDKQIEYILSAINLWRKL